MRYWRWGIGFGVVGGIVLVADAGSVSAALQRVGDILAEMASTLLVLGALAGANAARIWYRGNQVVNWPSVSGVVTRSRVESRRMRGSNAFRAVGMSTYYRIDLAYAYEVEGRRFEGRRWRFGAPPGWSKDRSRSEKLIAPFAVGQAVQVRFDPRRPAESAIEPGVAPFWHSIVWFAAVCLGLGMLGLIHG